MSAQQAIQTATAVLNTQCLQNKKYFNDWKDALNLRSNTILVPAVVTNIDIQVAANKLYDKPCAHHMDYCNHNVEGALRCQCCKLPIIDDGNKYCQCCGETLNYEILEPLEDAILKMLTNN